MLQQNSLLFAELPDISEVEPRSAKDDFLFQEVKDVLKKHNALSRFGLNLLHDHFPISDNEVLVESCDHNQRILTMKVVNKSEILGLNVIETNWRLDNDKVIAGCTGCCVCGAP